MDNNILTIEGGSPSADADAENVNDQKEGDEVTDVPSGSRWSARSFKRSYRLPTEVDGDRIEAELKNGVLSVRLPKAEAAKPRNIKVKGL